MARLVGTLIQPQGVFMCKERAPKRVGLEKLEKIEARLQKYS